jgi:hypothetical protein
MMAAPPEHRGGGREERGFMGQRVAGRALGVLDVASMVVSGLWGIPQ